MPIARGQKGYAMAALLVAMSVMGIMMGIVMPTWKQMARREKEAELLFRGEQYVRAIRLFQQRAGPGVLPPSVELLVDQRYLRRAYKDPVTGEKFLVLPGVTPASGSQTSIQFGNSGGARGSAPASRSSFQDRMSGSNSQGGIAGAVEQPAIGSVPGGISGVVSRSPNESLRLYNGRSHYNEWEFRHVAAAQAAGGGGVDGRGAGGRSGAGARGAIGPSGAIGPNIERGGASSFGNPNGRGGRGGAQPPDGSQSPPPRGGFTPVTPPAPQAPVRR